MPTSLLGTQQHWCSAFQCSACLACSACSALGVLGARPLGMLGTGSVPLLGVLCPCRTRWSSAPAVHCHVFHRVQRSASSDNQIFWFSGARQCWPWAAPVLGQFLAWPSRRVVMHSAQPPQCSVAIWCSSSAHGARSPCSSLCTAWRSTIFPRRLALFFFHLLAYACAYCACMSFISACIHASHSASSLIFLNPSLGDWYIYFLLFSGMLQQTIVCRLSRGYGARIQGVCQHLTLNGNSKTSIFSDHCRCRLSRCGRG